MVTEHQLRERAYYIWEKEGRHLGQAETHWHKAQAELQADVAGTGAAKSPAKTLVAKTAKPAASRAKAAPKVAAAARKSPRRGAADTAALH